MAFERFGSDKARGVLNDPTVTITPDGYIAFSPRCVQQFDLESYGYVVLFFDRERMRVGIMPTRNGDDDGALPLRRRKYGMSVYAARFLRHYQLFPKQPLLYPVEWDDELDMMIIEYRYPVNVGASRIRSARG